MSCRHNKYYMCLPLHPVTAEWTKLEQGEFGSRIEVDPLTSKN